MCFFPYSSSGSDAKNKIKSVSISVEAEEEEEEIWWMQSMSFYKWISFK